MKEIVITDLTRFGNDKIVCTAGIDRETGQCVRPMPYLQKSKVEELNILPGAVLKGKMKIKDDVVSPHNEDADYSNLKFVGPVSSDEFETILKSSLSPSVGAGFGIEIEQNEKYIPFGSECSCSIITVNVSAKDISIVEDSFSPGRVKLHFRDQAGQDFRYLSITDLGFHNYAMKHVNDGKIRELESFVRSQTSAYLRVGLSRRFTPGGGE